MAQSDEIAQFRVHTTKNGAGEIIGQKFQYRSRECYSALGVLVVAGTFGQWRDFVEAEETV